MQYSGKSVNRAVVFEILVGRIDLGASIRILSQYPQEDEFLWPPRCCLEVGVVSSRQVAWQLHSRAGFKKKEPEGMKVPAGQPSCNVYALHYCS